jgi:hypothetical protein
MKTISTKMLVALCAVALMIPLVAGYLATSNVINVTVTPHTYLPVVLTINGTSTSPYAEVVHPGDKLVLVASAFYDSSEVVADKTITFFNNAAYPIGTQTTNATGALTTQGNDVYAFRAELT